MSKWKQIILESDQPPPEENYNPSSKYQIYCDLDGVLVDWEGGALATINAKRFEIKKNIRKYMGLTPDRRDRDYLAFKFAKKIATEIGWDGEITGKDLLKGDVKLNKLARNMIYMLIGHNRDFWSNLDWAPGGQELWNFISPYNPTILSTPMMNDPKSEEGKRIWCKSHLGLEGDKIILVINKGIDTGNRVGILIDDKTTKLAEFRGIGILHKTGNAHASIERLKDLGFK